MNRIAIAIGLLVVWTGLAFAAGWVWRSDRADLTAANGRIIATGEAHTRERDAWRALRTVADTAQRAEESR